jgi:hypothetical protein
VVRNNGKNRTVVKTVTVPVMRECDDIEGFALEHHKPNTKSETASGSKDNLIKHKDCFSLK